MFLYAIHLAAQPESDFEEIPWFIETYGGVNLNREGLPLVLENPFTSMFEPTSTNDESTELSSSKIKSFESGVLKNVLPPALESMDILDLAHMWVIIVQLDSSRNIFKYND